MPSSFEYKLFSKNGKPQIDIQFLLGMNDVTGFNGYNIYSKLSYHIDVSSQSDKSSHSVTEANLITESDITSMYSEYIFNSICSYEIRV